ncbi:helix-turn-helix domain-containing protein [Streptomyces sp. NPDC047917]|uniref:helix-turn-helix domain-containing protein n=1 Tax=Streptomyces sp. NPDC047917 TaxID=3365491 RepID=UPI00371D2EBD
MQQRKVRRLREVPDPDSPVGQLARALRVSRRTAGLSQGQAADAIDVSSSTVQRAEAGRRVPDRRVVDGYVGKLGLDPELADRLWNKASRPAGRQRRTLTDSPSAWMVSSADELGRALTRVWEEDDRPSMQVMEDRVSAAREAEKGRYMFLSRSTANRIIRRRQLPTSVEQLRSYLRACQVRERQVRIWIDAYRRVRLREQEEAKAKKEAEEEERKWWRGQKGYRRAMSIVMAAGFQPVEPFPGSSTTPWAVRCKSCWRFSRVRLASIVSERHRCRCAPANGQYAGPITETTFLTAWPANRRARTPRSQGPGGDTSTPLHGSPAAGAGW